MTHEAFALGGTSSAQTKLEDIVLSLGVTNLIATSDSNLDSHSINQFEFNLNQDFDIVVRIMVNYKKYIIFNHYWLLNQNNPILVEYN